MSRPPPALFVPALVDPSCHGCDFAPPRERRLSRTALNERSRSPLIEHGCGFSPSVARGDEGTIAPRQPFRARTILPLDPEWPSGREPPFRFSSPTAPVGSGRPRPANVPAVRGPTALAVAPLTQLPGGFGNGRSGRRRAVARPHGAPHLLGSVEPRPIGKTFGPRLQGPLPRWHLLR